MKKKLRRMIEDLEVETEYRKAVVLALAHAVRPAGFRFNYLMYAVNEGFTAKEFREMDNFWRDICLRHDSISRRQFLTRQAVVDSFDVRIPTRAGKLEEILAADRADGENGVFHLLSRIVLDRDPNFTDEEDNESVSANPESSP